ncbi:unnamed protein product, partial [Rotaria sordida]
HSLVNKDIERAVAAVQTVIGLGRVVRERKVVPMKYPLPEFVVIHKDASVLKDVESLEDFVREGLNVRKVTLSQNRELYGVEMRAEPNYPTLGKKAGAKVKSLTQQIRDMTDADIEKLLSKGQDESPLTTIDDVPIESEDIHIVYRVAKQTQYEATAEQGFVVLLDYTADASLKDEGLIHEITSRVQKLRKEAKLIPSDDITIYYSVEPQTSEIARVASEQREEVEAILKKPFVPLSNLTNKDNSNVVITKKLSDYQKQSKVYSLELLQTMDRMYKEEWLPRMSTYCHILQYNENEIKTLDDIVFDIEQLNFDDTNKFPDWRITVDVELERFRALLQDEHFWTRMFNSNRLLHLSEWWTEPNAQKSQQGLMKYDPRYYWTTNNWDIKPFFLRYQSWTRLPFY